MFDIVCPKLHVARCCWNLESKWPSNNGLDSKGRKILRKFKTCRLFIDHDLSDVMTSIGRSYFDSWVLVALRVLWGKWQESESIFLADNLPTLHSIELRSSKGKLVAGEVGGEELLL